VDWSWNFQFRWNDCATNCLPLDRLGSCALLNRAPILIVEDEPYIALELQISIEDAGGEVVGPAGSARAALTLLETSVVAGSLMFNSVIGT
jgi:hypothetical protein